MHTFQNSSNLTSANYDAATKALTVGFKSGGSWRYADVPEDVYQGLIGASSPGGYFHAAIKGKYESTKV